ncbi:hypothetical protein SKAU_G00267460 [Synaphobranchus kaupii]|uniref:Thyroglobulin type-1 domain-containing protein n=1 Tax=Synaphobranchus kaupii TaxID=118154 RepID=A0A9Q1EZL0_SYNKA|nr:hypothetical protein SKAU_G00267460 [Synaphobranchus kaupii]
MAEQQNEPLISHQAKQTTINMGPAGGDSSKRAFKRSQINSLEENTNSMQKEMGRRQSGSSAGMAMHLPMSNMAMMTVDSSEDPKPREEPSSQKTCLQQAIGAGRDDFRPMCDELGNYLPMQCQKKTGYCWCVDANGKMIEGTMGLGRANCGGMSRGMARMAAVPNMLETKAE